MELFNHHHVDCIVDVYSTELLDMMFPSLRINISICLMSSMYYFHHTFSLRASDKEGTTMMARNNAFALARN